MPTTYRFDTVLTFRDSVVVGFSEPRIFRQALIWDNAPQRPLGYLDNVAYLFDCNMPDNWALRRIKMREKIAELKSAAIADLERRGYDVRGKTPAQIKQMLKRRPSKQVSDTRGASQLPPPG